MREYRSVLLLALLFLSVPLIVNAQYWFQSGARAGPGSSYNNGAKVSIETVYNQGTSSGSMGFWVGETLQNGAFIQAGYLIPNETGYYPSGCTDSGCSSSQLLKKGTAAWFFEYFTQGGSKSNFLGSIGPNASAGQSGSFHAYGFYSKGDIWYIFMDNSTLGEVNLGANSSGSNGPAAFAEVANASNAASTMLPVIFSNLSVYKSSFLPVPEGYSYIGYGVGSQTGIPNPYGIRELGNKVNYFQAGSGLPEPSNGNLLWQLGYMLKIESSYGNISGTNQYIAYKSIHLVTPSEVYLNNTSRESFSGWTGTGIRSYTGPSPSTNVTLFSNITEIANWDFQYLLNVSSQFGTAEGYGWYNANSTASYSVSPSDIYTNSTARLAFAGWSNGEKNTTGKIKLTRPYSLYTVWGREYHVNVSSMLGGAHGSGWYSQNSTAAIAITSMYRNISDARRIAFYSWSNGNRSASMTLPVNSPISISAIFRNQSRLDLSGFDKYGNRVQVTSFYIDNKSIGNSSFLFNGNGYELNTAYYKGTVLYVNQSLNISSPSNLSIYLPIYDVAIRTADIFGIPVNASLSIRFLNGSTTSAYSGASGTTSFSDVPYGFVAVSARYGYEVMSAQAENGAVARITIISLFDIEVFSAVAILGFITYFFSSRRLSRPKPK
ncbi:MAG: hypothetical protein ACYCO0_02895 [Candidatus Micrarchaeaceae archaeon]